MDFAPEKSVLLAETLVSEVESTILEVHFAKPTSEVLKNAFDVINSIRIPVRTKRPAFFGARGENVKRIKIMVRWRARAEYIVPYSPANRPGAY